MDANIQKLHDILKNSDNIVFFGGAGVSTESGIPDFRSVDGLYHMEYKYPPETIISHSFFVNNPKEFYRFYKNKMLCPQAKPNAAHLALAKLEQMGKLKAVVTQNIDGLHQAAGSKTVYELHGSVLRNYCQRCGAFYDMPYVKDSEGIPVCCAPTGKTDPNGNPVLCGGIVKPDVVLYEEGLDQDVINGAVRAISRADVLIIGGTSLVVYPAAGLIDYFRGSHLVVINKAATPRDKAADLLIQDSIGKVLGEAVEGL